MSSLIDLATFNDFPQFSGQYIEPCDILAILASLPRVTPMPPDSYRWNMTLFQTENQQINIEFDTHSSIEEPKFQRLRDPVGCLVFIKHIKPWEEGHASLFTPFGHNDQGHIHFNHRTFLVLDTNRDDLLKFERVNDKVQSLVMLF